MDDHFLKRSDAMTGPIPTDGGAAADQGEIRIVVGVDGSPCADRAAAYAADQAAHTGALLQVICAYHLLPVEEMLIVPIGLIEQVAAAVVAEALDQVHEVQPGVVTKGEHTFGSPGRVLVEFSEGATELVVGARGLGHHEGIAMGSVSEYVVHNAHCTTTVVR